MRAPARPVRTAWRLWAFAAALMIVLPLACGGCTADRYLTKDQDDELAKFCAQPGGCVVLPANQWRAIKQLLERLGIKPEESL